jgi:hypothetical protein
MMAYYHFQEVSQRITTLNLKNIETIHQTRGY